MFERLEKMDRRTLVVLVIAIGVALLIFGGVASGIRQAGWNEGFLVGLLSSSAGVESGQAITPYLALHRHGGFGWHPFGIVGGFFRFLFFGFLIMLFFRFVACRRWARYGHHAPGSWGDHGRHWASDRGGEQSPVPPQPTADAAPSTATQGPEELRPTQPTSLTYL